MVDWFEYLENRRGALAFLIEDQSAVFLATVSEKADVARARQFLGCAAGRVRGIVWRRGAGYGTDGVEMVGYKRFIRYQEEEGELFEYGNLGDA